MGVNRYLGGVISADPNTPTVESASGTWTLAEAYQNIGNWPMAQSQIQNSLRFNSADSAKLIRTPAVAGNRKTWTFSAWVKRSGLGSAQGIFHAYDGSSSRRSSIQFNANDTIGWDQGGSGTSGLIDTVAVFRDPSAWYHLVCVADYSNATAANRAKIYVNGVLQTVTTTDDFDNADGLINATEPHQIGSVESTSYLSGYLANINFVDGLALDPDYFGFTDANGIWQPKQYKGAYGTDGFYLDFLESDVLYSTTTGGKFSTQSATGIRRDLGNDSSAYFSGMTISGDFDFYWTYGTGSGSLTPGDAYIVGVVAASYQASFNYDNAYIGGASSTLFYTLYGSAGFATRGYVSGSQTDALTYSDNPGTTTYVRMTRSGSTLYVYQGSPGSWTLKKTFTGTFSGDLYFFVGSGDKNENISLNNVTFASINGGTRTLTDAGTIAGDASGNGNGWGTANIQTSGSSSDWMVDSPTNYGTDTGVGGEVRGNYATLNPLSKLNWLSQGGVVTPSNGNLQFAVDASGNMMDATIAVSSGKWYWEITQSAYIFNGIRSTRGIPTGDLTYRYYQNNGQIQYVPYNSTSATVLTTVATSSSGDIIGIALDLDNQTISWYKNNSLLYTATSIVADEYAPCVGGAASSSGAFINFGQRPFAYTAPSGFKALCTQNLPEPTVKDGGDYFKPVLYNATDGVAGSVTGVGFAPDFVWVKSRSGANSHGLFDKVRGVEKGLFSNLTNAEISSNTYLTAFNSDGFSHGGAGLIANGSLVAWNWKANGAGVTNTAGSINSTVSANTTAGFSIVTYTGTANSETVGHGLGVAPSMIIVKVRGTSGDWPIYHASVGREYFLLLNSTSAVSGQVANYWGTSGIPSSTVFGIKGGGWSNNYNGYSHVAYCFSAVSGYSAFGSYTGNGSTDGPFVYLGFRPEFVMWKRSDSTGSWYIQDMARNPYNQATNSLYPNLADAETSGDDMDYLSNGFKVRDTFSYINASGGTYIYAAFAENPFKLSRAR